VLPDTVVGFAEGLGFGKVESLKAEIAKSVKSMVYAEIFVGEARVWSIGEGAEGFDEFFTAGMDEEAAGSRSIQQGGVDAGDFVADFPGVAGAGDGEAGFA
jgi:hypothetical protein